MSWVSTPVLQRASLRVRLLTFAYVGIHDTWDTGHQCKTKRWIICDGLFNSNTTKNLDYTHFQKMCVPNTCQILRLHLLSLAYLILDGYAQVVWVHVHFQRPM